MCYNTSSNNHLELLFNRGLYGVYLSRLVDTIQVKNTMQQEIWKDIMGYENKYWVSNKGDVKNINKLLKQNKTTSGYYQVWLYKGGLRKYKGVHRLVAKAFIPNLENKEDVNHIDNDRKNNNVENLEWVTHLENISYCIKQGRQTKGEMSKKSNLKEKDILDIRRSKLSTKELSFIYKVSTRNIRQIIRKELWKHI